MRSLWFLPNVSTWNLKISKTKLDKNLQSRPWNRINDRSESTLLLLESVGIILGDVTMHIGLKRKTETAQGGNLCRSKLYKRLRFDFRKGPLQSAMWPFELKLLFFSSSVVIGCHDVLDYISWLTGNISLDKFYIKVQLSFKKTQRYLQRNRMDLFIWTSKQCH